ncbi:PaaI family thioesterase [Sphingomonas sp. HDW15A]|uniref:PaaI family thioesterase n=1 Tax=Sphingomonas sp. HDW15A TaxID=2714942 RepID=UPI00140E939A|nr:PaaI family thioesterase [Sphingomonas sp. HDW15A]QIK95934.1 PaaI family thioesterase [Sphingomonas sp. HDW15A]
MNDIPELDAAKRGGDFDPERFFELARTVGHGRALGLEFRAAQEGWIELALPWREELVGVKGSGVLASGAILSLLDTCGGASVWLAIGRYQPIVTIDLRLDYFRPALKGETVIARCRCDKLTRQIAFVSGFAHTGDPERLVARATGTFMLNP